MGDGFDLLGALQRGGASFESDIVQCSRAGCVSAASTRLEWRNPRIHDENRVKIWLACPEHRDYLHGFLEQRSFPVRAVPLEDATPTEENE